jgi:hypothetical protein
LRTGAAVSMLTGLVGHARVSAELVSRCDHLPLALRAAAAVLIQSPSLCVADLVARLTPRSLLAELAVDDLDPRARLLARYRAMSAVDPAAAAAFQYLGTDGARVRTLSAPVTRRLAEFGLLEDGGLAPLTRQVAVELGRG